MTDFDCATGCGSAATSQYETRHGPALPPDGWITLHLSITVSDPPHAQRNATYSAVVCSTDCAITFLAREHRVAQMTSEWSLLESSREETRTDIAASIGAFVLDAMDVPDDDAVPVMLLLDADRFALPRDYALLITSVEAEESA